MEVNRIYNQDCLEFLASVPSDTIDLRIEIAQQDSLTIF